MAGPEAATTFRTGTGESLVLLAVWASPWHKWEPVLPLLTSQFDILIPTLPGFAKSAPLVGPASVSALARGVGSAMDQAGFDTAHVVGNSMGGWVAMEFARSGRARTVGALSPAGGWSAKRRAAVRRFFGRNRLLTAATHPLLPLFFRSSLIRQATVSTVVARPRQLTPRQAVEMARDTLPADLGQLRPLFDEELQPYPDPGVPSLLAWSEMDRLTPLRSDGPAWRAAAPHAEFRVVPGVGHVPMYDDPELVANTIRELAARAG